MRIKVSQQVAGFVRRLPPEPRRKMRLALKAVARGKGNIRALEGPLASYWRLRVASYRVILFYSNADIIECVFAEHRSIVYEIFQQALREVLSK
jgi:mRNA-degrading endonuclease RelE of RelBE toxin-antitoxin system